MPNDDASPAMVHVGGGQQPARATPVALVPGLARPASPLGEGATPRANGSAPARPPVPAHPPAARPAIRGGPRFLVFCAIGGSVFLLGLAIQAVLTGRWHVPPVASFFIQGVISVETNFLLNRWLTWRDRDTPFWPAFARFNAQRTVTVALNLVCYALLIRLGVNYLVANVMLTVAFTAVNYLAGDRFVFLPSRRPPPAPAHVPGPVRTQKRRRPGVSVVIPCRRNAATIRPAVESLLDQDYPNLREIILVGSPADDTWTALADLADPRLVTWEVAAPPGVRDANFKRDAGIKMTTSKLIALVDSDVVLAPDWLSRAVTALESDGVSCVAGGIRSVRDDFWGRYTDYTFVGAKTPRIPESYLVTAANFGAHGRKPPISANALFTRELYERCPIDPAWSHGSYEDYEWFWRVARAGSPVLVCADLCAWHHHRRGLRALAREYLRSSRGCAYFVRAHADCPFARRRLRQAITLPLAAIAGLAVLAAAVLHGYSLTVAAVMIGGLALLSTHQAARTLRPESVAYPVAGLALGLVFTAGLVTHLIRSGTAVNGTARNREAASGTALNGAAVILDGLPTAAVLDAPPSRNGSSGQNGHRGPGSTSVPESQPAQQRQPIAKRHDRPIRRAILHPLTAICCLQAALSLTLIPSNTAFVDEADYLWLGRLLIAHWLHGTTWPAAYGEQVIPGSPFIYPPLGAMAGLMGGLAGARILSLAFMLAATVLLYLTASMLFGRTAAVLAAAIWAFTEPVLRLAFATFDPLSVLLMALSAWLAVQAGRRRHGELVAASAAVLALASATAYASTAIAPVVIAFAFFIWRPRLGIRQAAYSAAWLTGGLVVFLSLILTATHSWAGAIAALSAGGVPGQRSVPLVLNATWAGSGLVIVLATIAAVIAIGTGDKQRAATVALLAGSVFLVAAAQLRFQTSWSLAAGGIWFAAMAVGYGGSKLIRRLPGASKPLIALLCVLVVGYPALASWRADWLAFHGWANSRPFISSLEPVVDRSRGLIYTSAAEHIAQYYTRQGSDWSRWDLRDLPLDPAGVPGSLWIRYYSAQLHNVHYGVIVLFYPTTLSSVKLPASILLSPHRAHIYQNLLGLVGANSSEPGLSALTVALEQDPSYRLVSVGPYDSAHIGGIYAIWRREIPR